MKTNRKSAGYQGEHMDSELHELFLEELADMYQAEHQLTKALPKMAKAAESDELKQAFQSHSEETENQISRLEQVFTSLNEKPRSKKCRGMQGIIEESEEMMKEQKNSTALDATLISAAQKAEHYEIASYGTLAAWAEQMGHDEAFRLLKETLSEEKAADEKLSELALYRANLKAEQTL
jgi:ferritin-like metal-binding protein YciE